MQYFTKFLITVLFFSVSSKIYSQDGKFDTNIIYSTNYLDLPKDYAGPFLFLLGNAKHPFSGLFKKYTDVELDEFFFAYLVPKFLKEFNVIRYELNKERKKQIPNNYPITIRVGPIFSEFRITDKDGIPITFGDSQSESQLLANIQIAIYQNIPTSGGIARLHYIDASGALVGTNIKESMEDLLFEAYKTLKTRSDNL
jgi:hypothetical protein